MLGPLLCPVPRSPVQMSSWCPTCVGITMMRPASGLLDEASAGSWGGDDASAASAVHAALARLQLDVPPSTARALPTPSSDGRVVPTPLLPTGLWMPFYRLIPCRPVPTSVSCHSTRAVSTSWAAAHWVLLDSISTAVSWSSLDTFTRF